MDLVAPLAHDRAQWRMACGRPADGDLRPYRLRGSIVSLLLWEATG